MPSGIKSPYKTLEEWRQWGVERGYDKRNPRSLYESENKEDRSWFHRGRRQSWLKDFNFDRIFNWRTFNEWKAHGLKNNYDQRNPTSLYSSEDEEERSWYARGGRKRWIRKFIFKKLSLPWKTFEEWKDYGENRDYDQRSKSSLVNSKKKEERSWFNKGKRKEWLDDFDFKEMFVDTTLLYSTFKTWRDYGIKKRYPKRNPNSICTSKDKHDRAWYAKGVREGWLENFNFNRIVRNWPTFEGWQEHGLENGYDQRNPTSLARSGNKEERKWYQKGSAKIWLSQFPFARQRFRLQLMTFEEWQACGFEHGYDKRNPGSFLKNGTDEEKSWYRRGKDKRWVISFPFVRLHQNHIDNSQKLESLLEDYVLGKEI